MTLLDVAWSEDIRFMAMRAVDHARGLSADTIVKVPAVYDAVIRCLIVTGEAARYVSPATQAELPNIDWAGMVGMRNVLVHRYRTVDAGELWNVLNHHLPRGADELQRYLQHHG